MKKYLSMVLLFSLVCVFVLSAAANADTVTKNYNFKDFSGIDIGSGMKLTVTQSDNYSISVTAEEKAFHDLKVEKSGSKLKIYFDRSWFFGSSRHGNVEVNITMPSLTYLDLSGGVIGKVTMDVSGKRFKAEMSGGTILHGNLKCSDVKFDLSGGSRVEMSGNGGNLKIEGSGGSMFRLKDFEVKDVDAELSGGSQAVVSMDGTLDADQSGGSRITYYGKMELGHTSFSGGSGISKGH